MAQWFAEAWAGPEEGVAAPPPPRLSFAPEAVARLGGALGRAQRGLQHLGGHLSARPELPEPGRELLRELLREHRRLQELTLALHEKHQREALQLAELQDKAGWAETKVLELGTTLEGLQWDSAKLRKREGRLDRHLAEALEQLTSGSYGCGSSGGFQGGQITLSVQKFEMLNAELEGNQELANSRMAELEKLQLELQAAVRGQERLKVALRSLPEEAVKEALEYKVLQSQFSLLYHESLQVKTQLDEARALLLATKNSHLRHIEHMEVGPARPPHLWVSPRGVPRGFWGDSGASGVREMARIGIQDGRRCHKWRKAVSKMAAGGISPTMPYSRWRPVPQSPINREMRHLISSLQNHNHQLKGDVQRYKRKLREVQAEINKVGGAWKAQENQKEMKLLLDMYKSAPKEQRDKVTLMAAERKSKAEEEEALLSEMDVTGQAFEDMQEQNLRLLQQLREKDDANFKLMSERIKANQIHKLLREEKDELAEQVLALKAQVEAQLQVVQKLEEKERGLQSALAAVEKELSLRSQALELHKRKKQRKVEVYADADQILQEEIKEYRVSFRDLLEPSGTFWELLGASGTFWNLLGAPGTFRDLPEPSESSWDLPGPSGTFWELPGPSGTFWELLGASGTFQDLPGPSGTFWELPGPSGTFRNLPGPSGTCWELLGASGTFWELPGPFGSFWELLGASGTFHDLLGPSRTFWELLGTPGTFQDLLGPSGSSRDLPEPFGTFRDFLGAPGSFWNLPGPSGSSRELPEPSGTFQDLLGAPGSFRNLPGPSGFWDFFGTVLGIFWDNFGNFGAPQEELSRLRRKLEKQRKVEVYADADQILQEEIKEYRARLTCPCCNARKKDAVLTKCFHVFCFECVKSRYDTRQRKCPKCNAAFGAHDFHRVYIS
uniref:E3 ubiquitin-protein ligase BRE1B n=1 Tax=Lonchura striata TaxID=40157 RepID=UPI000B4D873E|nr:E3 ubiquitin-protein ligase BRE1B [Lonchura striata domestica]